MTVAPRGANMAERTLGRPKCSPPQVVVRHGRLVRLAPTVPPDPPPPSAAATLTADGSRRLAPSGGTTAAIILLVVVIFLPNIWTLGSLNLSPALLYLILGFVPLLGFWLAGRAGSRLLSDWLVLGFAAWAAGTRFILLDTGAALEPAGVVLLQTAGAYLAGRVLVRDLAATRLAFGAAIIGVIAMLPFLLWEAVTGTKPLLDLAGLFGSTLTATHMDPRWGFSRAQGGFEHPILLGIYCATLVSPALFLFDGPRGRALRWVGTPCVAIAAVTSLSTGALLSMNTQIALIGWNALLREVRKRWTTLLWLVAALYVAVDTLSNRTPFHLFVDYATFNSQSSYNRILIWEFGSAAVMQSPLLGHGTDDWERPAFMHASMDNFWLVIAYRYGVTGVALLLGAFLFTIVKIARWPSPGGDFDRARYGVLFALVATMIAIVSVHLWNNSYIWLIFMLGAVSWMVDVPSSAAPAEASDASRETHSAQTAGDMRRARLRRLGF